MVKCFKGAIRPLGLRTQAIQHGIIIILVYTLHFNNLCW